MNVNDPAARVNGIDNAQGVMELRQGHLDTIIASGVNQKMDWDSQEASGQPITRRRIGRCRCRFFPDLSS